jgi:non-specific serine/threonine protein kinase
VRATRLLTLTGTGGTGKTRLALEVAADLVKEFPDGVWLFELAPIADPALVPQAIASVLGVRAQPGHALLDSIVDSLRAKHALLVLDNCEHLIDTSAQIADRLLRAAPGIKILATSREALGIAGETSYRVPSLALPDARARSVEDVASRESVQLFLSRASAVQPNFQLSGQNAPAVAQIVRRLDGIPLAIELAAARSKLFSAEQIAARLDDHFRLLTGGSRTALPRQQTLRALIDWSYDLLSPEECALLRRMSVFAGGCTYEAIEAVAGHDLDVLDLLERLVDKSLVLVEEQETSTRYRLLEMIRQYGRDKLRESGEAEVVRNRHLDYYANLVTRDGPFIYMATGLGRFKQLRTEADNARAAMAWGLEIKAERVLEVVTGFGGYWRRAGLLVEGIDWVERTIAAFDLSTTRDGELTERTLARAQVFLVLGLLQFEDGRSVPARAALQTSVDLFRGLRDHVGLAAGLGMLSLVDLFLGNNDACLEEADESAALLPKTGYGPARIASLTGRSRIAAQLLHDLPMARALTDEAVALARGQADPWLLAMPLMASGMVAYVQGDHVKAQKALVESMDIYREQEDAHGCNMVRSSLAEVMRAKGDLDGAARMYRDVIPSWMQMGQLGGIARSLECLGFVAMAQASQIDGATRSTTLARAAQLLGAAEKVREISGAVMMPSERQEYDRESALLRTRMQPEELALAWERGRSLTLDGAVSFARAG